MTKQIFSTLAAILLLSGCTVDPAAIAIIPTPVPEFSDPPCEPMQEAVFVAYRDSGSEIAIYCGEVAVKDRWLLNWAEEAITRDGSLKLAEALGEDGNPTEVTTLYMGVFLAADRACLEDRRELATLIESYASEYEKRKTVDFPLLSAADLLSSETVVPGRHNGLEQQETSLESVRVDCSDKVASFSAIPDPPPLCIANSSAGESLCFNGAPSVNPDAACGGQSSDSLSTSRASSE